ncbi:uncharacterized protein LOC143034401 [Oratosquilla oratoria]|uniref:uncharacterized protein LOC143034401 n=1 Tax=Oratosquilla oratoria TaxID=337810 RepID=UPI003F7763DE
MDEEGEDAVIPRIVQTVLPIITGASGLFAGCAVIYSKVRPWCAVKVNCWFCNKDSRVAYRNIDGWDCPHCQQYNGFTQDGDYNREIPAQHCEELNPQPRTLGRGQQGQSPTRLALGNGLCHTCNLNQTLKVRALADFSPSHPDRYDLEAEQYRKRLERTYALCRSCEATLHQTLGQQDSWLRPRLIQSRMQPTNPYTVEIPQHLPVYVRVLQVFTALVSFILLASNLHQLQHHSGQHFVPLEKWLFPLEEEQASVMERLLLPGVLEGIGVTSLLLAILGAGKQAVTVLDAMASFLWVGKLALASSHHLLDSEDFHMLQMLSSVVTLTASVLVCVASVRMNKSHKDGFRKLEGNHKNTRQSVRNLTSAPTASSQEWSNQQQQEQIASSQFGTEISQKSRHSSKSFISGRRPDTPPRASTPHMNAQQQLDSTHISQTPTILQQNTLRGSQISLNNTTYRSSASSSPGSCKAGVNPNDLDSTFGSLKISTPVKATAGEMCSSNRSMMSEVSSYLSCMSKDSRRSVLSPSRLSAKNITQSSWVAGGYWGGGLGPTNATPVQGGLQGSVGALGSTHGMGGLVQAQVLGKLGYPEVVVPGHTQMFTGHPHGRGNGSFGVSPGSCGQPIFPLSRSSSQSSGFVSHSSEVPRPSCYGSLPNSRQGSLCDYDGAGSVFSEPWGRSIYPSDSASQCGVPGLRRRSVASSSTPVPAASSCCSVFGENVARSSPSPVNSTVSNYSFHPHPSFTPQHKDLSSSSCEDIDDTASMHPSISMQGGCMTSSRAVYVAFILGISVAANLFLAVLYSKGL